MASILFLFYLLFFPYHLPVYNLFSDPVKKYFMLSVKKYFMLSYSYRFGAKNSKKNSQENSLGDNPNFSKNSFKYSQLSISFK